MNQHNSDRRELNQLYNTPHNRRLKFCAIAVIAIVIALLLAMIIWIDSLSARAMLIMRGCAGLGALIFVVLVGILTYRVNRRYITGRKQ